MLDVQRQQFQLVWPAIPELNLVEEATVIPAGRHRTTFVLQARAATTAPPCGLVRKFAGRQFPAGQREADIRSRARSPPVVFIQGVVINGPTCTVALQISGNSCPA